MTLQGAATLDSAVLDMFKSVPQQAIAMPYAAVDVAVKVRAQAGPQDGIR